MANELTLELRLGYAKGAMALMAPPRDTSAILKRNVAGVSTLDTTQTVGTAAEAVTASDVAVGGYIRLENLDGINFIELEDTGGSPFGVMKLLPGDVAIFRTGDNFLTNYTVRADTAACEMRVTWIDL